MKILIIIFFCLCLSKLSCAESEKSENDNDYFPDDNDYRMDNMRKFMMQHYSWQLGIEDLHCQNEHCPDKQDKFDPFYEEESE